MVIVIVGTIRTIVMTWVKVIGGSHNSSYDHGDSYSWDSHTIVIVGTVIAIVMMIVRVMQSQQ